MEIKLNIGIQYSGVPCIQKTAYILHTAGNSKSTALRTHPQFLIHSILTFTLTILSFQFIHILSVSLAKDVGIDLKSVQHSWRKGPGDSHTCRANSNPVLESDVNTSSLTTRSFEYSNTEQETRDQARGESLIRGEASFHLVIYPFHCLRLSSGSRHTNRFSATRKK